MMFPKVKAKPEGSIWTDDQWNAICLDDKNIIVSAGAGSGKTAVLTERILEKLKNGVLINQMIILTFTKAAAGEMRERIRKKIKMINALNATDSYPFLMEVFEDFEFAHINRAMLLEILDTVLEFIDERNSKKPTQIALSFAGLSNEINKMLVLKDYTPRFVVDKDEICEARTINSIINS